jgi:hypothetical protein
MSDRFCLNIRPRGLGIIVTQLSFVLATGRPGCAVVSNADNIIYDLKRIFNISDDQLIIESGTHGHPDLETDELGTYAPYYHSDTVTVLGQQFKTGKTKKPCVALVMHHGHGLGDDQLVKSMPYNKFATAEQYQKVFTWLTNLGYDVITMNQNCVELEQKIYMLNELCDFVVGYEGGLQHLAHMLKIPCIVFPWRYNDAGGEPMYPGMYYETHRFHADRRTWFLKTTDELVFWTRQDLDRVLDRLNSEQGNNILFAPGTVIELESLTITAHNGMNLTPRIMWCQTRGTYTTSFIKQHLPAERMVKYPLKSTT